MAGKDPSVAPKARVNILYRPGTDGAQEEVEIPLRFMAIGDYTGREDDTELEEREIYEIRDKKDFEKVMGAMDLELEFDVDDVLSGNEGDQLPVKLEFENMNDFNPGRVVDQVPALRKQLEMRNLFSSLKGELGNIKKLRQKIAEVLSDDQAVDDIVQHVRRRRQEDE